MMSLLNQPRYQLRWVNDSGGDWLHPTKQYIGQISAKNAAHSAFVDEEVDRDDIIQVFQMPYMPGDEPIEEYDRQDFDL